MDFHFRINENDIGDWSSRDILLQILLKLCESDAVTAIGCFHFWLDSIVLRSPDVCGFDYVSDIDKEGKYVLKSGVDAKQNKLAGLYVEKEEVAIKQRNKPFAEYYIEPGLNGIRKVNSYIQSLYEEERKKLPPYLKDFNLKSFEFSIPVIWGMNKTKRIYEDNVFMFISEERDNIAGKCDSTGCSFSFCDTIEENLNEYNEPYLINHLNKIQKILDEVAPKEFELRPEFLNIDLLNQGILNRKEREFYMADDKKFEKAVDRFWMKKSEIDQVKLNLSMRRMAKLIAKYKERESKSDPRAKEAGERLQSLQNRMAEVIDNTDKLKSRENEDKDN